MKVLLKIGHYTYLLPTDANLATILKTLGAAVEVEDKRYCDEGLIVERPIKLTCELISCGEKVHGPVTEKKAKAKRLTLNAPSSILL